MWSSNGSSSNVPEYPLALDVVEKDDEFVITAAIPGANPDDLDITLANNVLTIRGEIKGEQQPEGGQIRLRERPYGRFARTLTLPAEVQNDQIQAHCENGILTVHVPKSEQAKPKRIPVTVHQMIEG